MDYIELKLMLPDAESAEIMVAQLSEWPFESFSDGNRPLCAYIPEPDYLSREAEISAFLDASGYPCEIAKIENRNWNALWESNFEPVLVDDRCLIRAPFHPEKEYDYSIEIMPKMSFGTGHHETTYLMIHELLNTDVQDKLVLDMGCGTGVLAILAALKGAHRVDAVDIDEWACENCRENIAVNRVEGIVRPVLGNAETIDGTFYDVILANINRNILMNDMDAYVKSLHENSIILLSGILTSDVAAIRAKAESLALQYLSASTRGSWAAVRFVKG